MAVATKENYPTCTKDTMEQITSYSEWGITYEGQGNRKVWVQKCQRVASTSDVNKLDSRKCRIRRIGYHFHDLGMRHYK